MFEEIGTIRKLNKQGKLDRPLRLRLALFVALVIIFGLIVSNDIFIKGVKWYSLVIPFVVGFPLGFFLLSRTSEVTWDRRRRIMKVSQLDLFGVLILLLYWIVRLVGAKYFLEHFYHNVLTISGATFTLLFGMMLGRLRKVTLSIHDLHESRK